VFTCVGWKVTLCDSIWQVPSRSSEMECHEEFYPSQLNTCVRVCLLYKRYVDGALSDNTPILDDATITVSPFAGESDICPNDFSSSFHHINLAGNYHLVTYIMFIVMLQPRGWIRTIEKCNKKESSLKSIQTT